MDVLAPEENRERGVPIQLH